MKKYKGIYSLVLLSLLILIPVCVEAYTPPAGSPLALKLHPRIMLIPDSYRQLYPEAFGLTVSEVRQRIAGDTELKSKLQNLIDTMDNIYNDTVDDSPHLAATYNAINFAFLYIMDPIILSGSPYNFSFQRTKNEYGNKAVEYGRYIATKAKAITSIPGKDSWFDYLTYDYGDNERYGCTNMSLAIVNDWVFNRVTKADRQLFMDAIINSYNFRYPAEINIFASGKQYGTAQNGTAGVLGFYGDDIDNIGSSYYSDAIDELLNKFNEYWLKGFVELHNKFYDGSSGSVQGTMYNREAIRNAIIMTLAISTVLNTNYINETSWLKYSPYYWLYSVNPNTYNGEYLWIMRADVGSKNAAMTRHWGKHMLEFNPIIYGLSKSAPQLSSLFKWIRDESGFLSGEISSSANIRYRTVLYELLFNNESVEAQSPTDLNLPLSKRIGNGEYIFRTGFTNSSNTVITFAATKWYTNDGGHAHRDFANFQIFKYGDLTTRRSIAKDFEGSGQKGITQHNAWYNTIGVLKPGEVDSKGFNDMGYRGGYNDSELNPEASAWQINGANHVGSVKKENVGSGDYDYVDYDYSNAWSDSKVDYAEREFVYLRSQGGTNDEYVVVFDRINSVDSAYTKYWLLQSPFTPKLLNNSNDEITMTAEDYPNDGDGIGGGRWVWGNSSPTKDNIIELTNTWAGNNSHGRLFNKTLLPDSFQINKTGGPDHYWEDAEGRLLLTKTLTEDEKNYHGTYTMQVQSTTGQKFDNFLNVIQFGDSDTLSQMNPTTRIDADTMVGTLINDPTVPRIVMFSKNPQGASVSSATYTANYSSSLTGKHLLVDMSPGTYDVYKNSVKILTGVTASSQGVLTFNSEGGSTFQIVQTGSTLTGDVNGDGTVDILDLQACVNVFLGTETRPDFVQRAKEVTEPLNECNVLDVQAIVNIILGP